MGFWRCHNKKCSTDEHGRLIFNFFAKAPVCPKCGADGRRNGMMISRLEIIHYEPASGAVGPSGSIGCGELACKPGVKAGSNPPAPIHNGRMSADQVASVEAAYFDRATLRTGDPTATTCPECRKTEVWRIHAEAMGEVVEDYPIEINMEQGTIAPATVTDTPKSFKVPEVEMASLNV